MVAGNGPMYTYVDIPLKISQFQPASSDRTIWPEMEPASPNPDPTREAIRLQGQQLARQAADFRQLTQGMENMNSRINQRAEVINAPQATPPSPDTSSGLHGESAARP